MTKTLRNSKDTVFRMIFKEKENALALYNAMNHSDYQDVELLEITTLENAIYVSYKNDVSFIINSYLCLYEHQSTINPNIPLRTLFYVSAQLSKLTGKRNLYGTKLVKIPTPKFVCFYNGVDDFPEYTEWKLSDAFREKTEKVQLEVIVDVYNINSGNNKSLLNTCKILGDYAIYTNKVRTYAKSLPIEEAVEQAITECINDNILAEFLRKNQLEAKSMTIFEYDEEEHIRLEREDAKAEIKIKLIRRMLAKSLGNEEIAELLGVDLSYVEEIADIVSRNPDITDGEIVEQML